MGDVGEKLDLASREPFSQQALATLCSALSTLPADCSYQEWLEVGLALHNLGWTEQGQGEAGVGFDLWDQWSARGGDKYPGREILERKWESFDRPYKGLKITIAGIYDRAISLGWTGASRVSTYSPTSVINGVASLASVLPQTNASSTNKP